MRAGIHQHTAASRLLPEEERRGDRPAVHRALADIDGFDRAENTFVQCRLQPAGRMKEPAHEADGQDRLALVGGAHHRIAFGRGECHRLLDQHVYASTQQLGADRRVKVMGGSHDRGIELAEPTAIVVARIRRAEGVRQLSGAGEIDIDPAPA